MLEAEFTRQREASWNHLEARLDWLEQSERDGQAPQTSQLFADICQDLNLCRHRGYSQELETHLNALVMRSTRFFRRPQRPLLRSFLLFFAFEFPAKLRAEWRPLLTALLLFLIPALIAWFGIKDDILWAQAILGTEGIESMNAMYGGETKLERDFDENFYMFGYYIFNNVSICFRLFAGGIFAGLGTIAVLIFNGLYLGAAAAYVQNYALDPNQFWTFVIAHGSLEITGIIIVGAAGLILGGGVLFPQGLSRKDSIFAACQRALPLLGGGSMMVFLAAFIEGFWSANNFSVPIKYLMGGLCWLFMFLWLGFVRPPSSELASKPAKRSSGNSLQPSSNRGSRTRIASS